MLNASTFTWKHSTPEPSSALASSAEVESMEVHRTSQSLLQEADTSSLGGKLERVGESARVLRNP